MGQRSRSGLTNKLFVVTGTALSFFLFLFFINNLTLFYISLFLSLYETKVSHTTSVFFKALKGWVKLSYDKLWPCQVYNMEGRVLSGC